MLLDEIYELRASQGGNQDSQEITQLKSTLLSYQQRLSEQEQIIQK